MKLPPASFESPILFAEQNWSNSFASSLVRLVMLAYDREEFAWGKPSRATKIAKQFERRTIISGNVEFVEAAPPAGKEGEKGAPKGEKK